MTKQTYECHVVDEAVDATISDYVGELIEKLGIDILFQLIPDDWEYDANITSSPTKQEFVWNYHYYRLWNKFSEEIGD